MISREVVGPSVSPFAAPWRSPLGREITLIVLIKLVLLLAIKAVWFTPTESTANSGWQVAAHLLGAAHPSGEERSR
ncbi:TPA: cytochrome oxidase putative small subunit CydP [Pseudomonas aeruginosa]